MTDNSGVDFLVRAAREFRRGGWVFTGFHWPVLAGQLACRLPGNEFAQIFEAGAGCFGPAAQLPTSTTDYPAYANSVGYRTNATDTLLMLGPRYSRVMLDGGNVDMLGRVNSSFLGDRNHPSVRLPGGGGAPDVAARATELVWLHGGTDLRRLQHRVDHVTAAPGPDTIVRLHTRWGILRLGSRPALEEQAAHITGFPEFVDRLHELGVDCAGAVERPEISPFDRQAATAVLVEAAGRGYAVATRIVQQSAAEPAPSGGSQ